jgi:hypothetical protein
MQFDDNNVGDDRQVVEDDDSNNACDIRGVADDDDGDLETCERCGAKVSVFEDFLSSEPAIDI